MAVEQQKDIYLFLSSGTGLLMDLAGGYNYQMQKALDLTNCNKFGGAKGGLLRRIIFLQPAIPSIKVPSSKTPLKEKLAKVEIEKANVGRLITLNSSVDDNQLKTFISATETVMVEEITSRPSPG